MDTLLDLITKIRGSCKALLALVLSMVIGAVAISDQYFTIPDSMKTDACLRLAKGMDRASISAYSDKRHISIDLVDCLITLDANITRNQEMMLERWLKQRRSEQLQE